LRVTLLISLRLETSLPAHGLYLKYKKMQISCVQAVRIVI